VEACAPGSRDGKRTMNTAENFKNNPPHYQERLNLLKKSLKIRRITDAVTSTVVSIIPLLI